MGFNNIFIIPVVLSIGITSDVSFDFVPDAFALKVIDDGMQEPEDDEED